MSKLNDAKEVVQPRLRDALERLQPRMAGLTKVQLLAINLDPLAAVAVARGALPGLLALRPRLAGAFTEFDVTNLDFLELYALALIQAETIHRGIVAKPQTLAALTSEALELRSQLIVDAKILVQRGLIPAMRLSKLKGPNGSRNTACDLLTLAALLRDCWSSIANRTATRMTDLERAEALGDDLISAIALRDQSTAKAVESADRRQRAYTLFVSAYDELRRAVVFLRWYEGDADVIAPSLYAKRKARRAKQVRVEDADNASPSPNSYNNSTPNTKDTNNSSVEDKGTDTVLH